MALSYRTVGIYILDSVRSVFHKKNYDMIEERLRLYHTSKYTVMDPELVPVDHSDNVLSFFILFCEDNSLRAVSNAIIFAARCVGVYNHLFGRAFLTLLPCGNKNKTRQQRRCLYRTSRLNTVLCIIVAQLFTTAPECGGRAAALWLLRSAKLTVIFPFYSCPSLVSPCLADVRPGIRARWRDDVLASMRWGRFERRR